MNKFEQPIMVIHREVLFRNAYFQGYTPVYEHDFYPLILERYEYRKRGPVEEQPEYKQPIAYAMIVHKQTHKIFAYQRSSKEGDYSEARLAGKWSWGIGGHIDKVDSDGNDPIRASLMRELREEVHMSTFDRPQIIGYINDDDTAVGSVHFGLLFIVYTDDDNVKPNDKEIAWGGFKSIQELKDILISADTSVETWSEIGLIPLEQFIKNADNE